MIDEPSSYLDVRQRLAASKVIRDLVKEDVYVVVVEHDLAVFYRIYIYLEHDLAVLLGLIISPIIFREYCFIRLMYAKYRHIETTL